MGFSEDSEVACLSHFMCQVEPWSRLGMIIFTPGGKAIFDAVLHALVAERHDSDGQDDKETTTYPTYSPTIRRKVVKPKAPMVSVARTAAPVIKQ